MFTTIHSRPLEEAIIAQEELDDLALMLKVAAEKSSKRKGERDRNLAFFLANQLGMSQEDIAEMAGISKQAVQQRVIRFGRCLQEVYRRPE